MPNCVDEDTEPRQSPEFTSLDRPLRSVFLNTQSTNHLYQNHSGGIFKNEGFWDPYCLPDQTKVCERELGFQ